MLGWGGGGDSVSFLWHLVLVLGFGFKAWVERQSEVGLRLRPTFVPDETGV